MISILLFSLAMSSSALATPGFDDPSDVGAPQVRYLSWCDKGRVVREGDRGEAVVQADCAAAGLACVQEERVLGGGYVSYGVCKNAR